MEFEPQLLQIVCHDLVNTGKGSPFHAIFEHEAAVDPPQTPVEAKDNSIQRADDVLLDEAKAPWPAMIESLNDSQGPDCRCR
jgi:hypothetical protein